MSRLQNRVPSWLYALLYGGLLLGLLLIVFFPTQKISEYCKTTVEQIFPGTTCRIGSIEYGFPLTLNFGNVELIDKQDPEEVIVSFQSLSVQADFHHRNFNIRGKLYGGDFQCRLYFKRNNGTILLTGMKAYHIDIGKWKSLHKFLGRDISGYLDMACSYRGNLSRVLQGEAEGMATVHNGSIELLHPILSLVAIELKDSGIEFLFRNRILTIKKGNFHGAEFNAFFNGVFHIAFPPGRSMLEISGELNPTLSLINADNRWKSIEDILRRRYGKATIRFIVNGTLAGPRFRFGG